MNLKPGLQVNGRESGSNNSLLNVVPGPVKTRTGNAHRERSEDFALRQVQKYGQNSANMGRFMTDSPLGLVQNKFIPRKGPQSGTIAPAVQANFKRNSSHEPGKTQSPG